MPEGPETCIEAARIGADGYARISGYDGKGHHQVWRQANGVVPRGYVIHHICENKSCVNLNHLEMLTIREHNFRHRKRCRHDESERRWGSDGRLRCKACRREDEKLRYDSDPEWREKVRARARERARKKRALAHA